MPKDEEHAKSQAVIEEIACTLTKLSRQVSAILEGRMKRKSILILLAHTTGMSQRQVDEVLAAIENLEKNHLKN